MVNKQSKDSKKPNIEELQNKLLELSEALSRERADAINVRRRADEERLKLANFYKSMVINELLPALDNLERALVHTPKDLAESDYVKGVQGVAKQFENALVKLDVEKIKTVGTEFDPNLHEAISIEDKGGDTEIISQELQAGYKIGDEIIRHALVKVEKK